jgi:hypothetical protein
MIALPLPSSHFDALGTPCQSCAARSVSSVSVRSQRPGIAKLSREIMTMVHFASMSSCLYPIQLYVYRRLGPAGGAAHLLPQWHACMLRVRVPVPAGITILTWTTALNFIGKSVILLHLLSALTSVARLGAIARPDQTTGALPQLCKTLA